MMTGGSAFSLAAWARERRMTLTVVAAGLAGARLRLDVQHELPAGRLVPIHTRLGNVDVE